MLALAPVLSFALAAYAAPTPHDSLTTTSAPLFKRASHAPPNRTTAWVKEQGARLQSKYQTQSVARRAGDAANPIVNLDADSTYYGTLAVGTPARSFNVILDTGSADLWLAGTECGRICRGITLFDDSRSSSFQSLNQSFSITYGSGAASGSLGVDIVQMNGFEVTNQAFGVVDSVSSGLLEDSLSGLLGLGFNTIASSGATPLAQTLSNQGALDEKLFSFFLTRYLDVVGMTDNAEQFGGEFMLGGTNSSLYTGDIDFVDIPDGKEGFWGIDLTTLTVNGTAISISSSESFAAIDTGTTLVGGPSDAIAALYAQIPGAQAGTGDLEGYWMYPCTETPTIQLEFGNSGKLWSIDPRDMNLAKVSSTMCVGSFFEVNLGGSSSNPSWIVGDTFLKNVYSVYRFDPPSVGFAQLSNAALGQNGVLNEQLATVTAVADPIRVSATSLPSDGSTASGNGIDTNSGDIIGNATGAAPQAFSSSAWTLASALLLIFAATW